jgi:ribose-phosphate pyrophosphokinase
MAFDSQDGKREPSRGPAIQVVAGNSNRPLADAIAGYLKQDLTKSVIKRFADGEIFVEIHDNVRGQDVFVIQSTSYPTNDNLMEMLIIVDALRRSSAKRITAVMPYFGTTDPDHGQAGRQLDRACWRRPRHHA